MVHVGGGDGVCCMDDTQKISEDTKELQENEWYMEEVVMVCVVWMILKKISDLSRGKISVETRRELVAQLCNWNHQAQYGQCTQLRFVAQCDGIGRLDWDRVVWKCQ